MVLLYPVLPLGAAVLVLQREEHAGGRGWLWFCGLARRWRAVLAVLGVAWRSHFREASGLVVGAALFVGALVVFL